MASPKIAPLKNPQPRPSPGRRNAPAPNCMPFIATAAIRSATPPSGPRPNGKPSCCICAFGRICPRLRRKKFLSSCKRTIATSPGLEVPMRTPVLFLDLLAGATVLTGAFPTQLSAAVSDADFNALKQMVQQLNETVQKLQQAREQDQKIHEQDQQQIQQLKERL